MLVVVLACLHATDVLAQPPRTSTWMLVQSADGNGALLHDAPWGDALATWPDGTAVRLLGDEVVDGEVTWLRVRDPVLATGWMAADRLAEPTVPIEPHAQRSIYGVRPVGEGGQRTCPPGFPVKGSMYGRDGWFRVAYGPDYPRYDEHIPSTCFRSMEEANFYGYIHWQDALPGSPNFPTPRPVP